MTVHIATMALALVQPPAAPPVGAGLIQRVDPIEYKVQMDISVPHLGRKTLWMPLFKEGQYHHIDMQRFDEFVAGAPFDRHKPDWSARPIDLPSMGSYATIERGSRGSYQNEMRITEYVTAYSAQADEAALAAIDWPNAWPIEVDWALRPQMYIESFNQRVVDLMNAWTGGEPRSVTPFHLGKELARRSVGFVRVDGEPVEVSLEPGSRRQRVITAIRVQGALAAIENQRGSVNDLVCLYVAVCRAAGLPARPIIGIDSGEQEESLVSWAEFYVPDAGWVTVDFERLVGSPGSMVDIHRPWPGLANDDDLNERIALSCYFYAPPIHKSPEPAPDPLLWAWEVIPEDRRNGAARGTLKIEVDRAPRRAPQK